MLRTITAGVVGVLVGVFVGGIVGANIGGNWMTGVSLGSLHGYEATSAVGAAVGALAFGALAFGLAIRRPRPRRPMATR